MGEKGVSFLEQWEMTEADEWAARERAGLLREVAEDTGKEAEDHEVLRHVLDNPTAYAAAVREVKRRIVRHFGGTIPALHLPYEDGNIDCGLTTDLICLTVMNGSPADDAATARERLFAHSNTLPYGEARPVVLLLQFLEAAAGLADLDDGKGNLRSPEPATADETAAAMARATLAGDMTAARALADKLMELDAAAAG